MAWSTRQLAELTGVTLRSIRHWHDVGLLAEPGRLSNGYKQYTARHLVRALRIARLTALGFRLDEVARMLDADQDAVASLHGLRTELDTRIAALRRLRSEVDELIALGAAPDLSPEALLAVRALGGDPVSRDVAIVLAHLLPGEDTRRFVATLADAPAELDRLNTALLDLPADAPPDEIDALAERTAGVLGAFFAAYPEAMSGAGDDDQRMAEVLTAVATESMNPAQRRVMRLVLDRLAGAVVSRSADRSAGAG